MLSVLYRPGLVLVCLGQDFLVLNGLDRGVVVVLVHLAVDGGGDILVLRRFDRLARYLGDMSALEYSYRDVEEEREAGQRRMEKAERVIGGGGIEREGR